MGNCYSSSQLHKLPQETSNAGSLSNIENSDIVSTTQDMLPVRLIDVNKTIQQKRVSFTKPDNWDFDVVSHTWTTGVHRLQEQLAREVRLLLAQSPSVADRPSAYESAFDSPNISGHAFFDDLMNFLDVLQNDGVTKVWIDALCIDQEDLEGKGEKSTEILKMGDFYKRSRACYVCPHGIDGGYQPNTAAEKLLPKWFSRVWTIQEFVFPKRIYFMVKKFDPVVQKQDLQRLLDSSWGRAPSESSTKFDEMREKTARVLLSDAVSEMAKKENPVYTVQLDDYVSLVCNQRLALSVAGAAQLVDLWGFVTKLVDLIEWKEKNKNCKFQSLDTWSKQEPRSLALRAIGSTDGYMETPIFDTKFTLRIPPETVFYRVKNRNSTYSQDRILSVLDLLGWDRAVGIDSSKELKEQILELGNMWKSSNRANLLLNMCAVDSAESIPGISWAPDLTSARLEERNWFHKMMADLYLQKYGAHVLDVQNTKLQLVAKAYEAHLIGTGSGKRPARLQFRVATASDPRTIQQPRVQIFKAFCDSNTPNLLKLCFEPRGPKAEVHMWMALNQIPKSSRNMANLFPNKNGLLYGRIYLNALDIHIWGTQMLLYSRPALICKLWMVLLGYSRHGDFDNLYQVVMLCLRDDRGIGEMHKVGIMIVAREYINFGGTQYQKYSIGDLGEDLSPFLWQAPA